MIIWSLASVSISMGASLRGIDVGGIDVGDAAAAGRFRELGALDLRSFRICFLKCILAS